MQPGAAKSNSNTIRDRTKFPMGVRGLRVDAIFVSLVIERAGFQPEYCPGLR
jgi:hypothetical protein